MKIFHDTQNQAFQVEIDGQKAYAKYEIIGDKINVYSTYVPSALEGQGIASRLVGTLYDWGKTLGLKPAATCSYAVAWLRRH